jgi:hypothetical protein
MRSRPEMAHSFLQPLGQRQNHLGSGPMGRGAFDNPRSSRMASHVVGTQHRESSSRGRDKARENFF